MNYFFFLESINLIRLSFFSFPDQLILPLTTNRKLGNTFQVRKTQKPLAHAECKFNQKQYTSI